MGNADLLGASLEWLLTEVNVPMFSVQAILEADKPQASGTQTKTYTPDPTPPASRLPPSSDPDPADPSMAGANAW